jgi:hypothetical protein
MVYSLRMKMKGLLHRWTLTRTNLYSIKLFIQRSHYTIYMRIFAAFNAVSSLIAIVEADDSWVVQFSHFSVKEYLTSTRLADASKDVSRYHIDLETAHTILAQACMAVLLQPDVFVEEKFPLAVYAAQHWPGLAHTCAAQECVIVPEKGDGTPL